MKKQNTVTVSFFNGHIPHGLSTIKEDISGTKIQEILRKVTKAFLEYHWEKVNRVIGSWDLNQKIINLNMKRVVVSCTLTTPTHL